MNFLTEKQLKNLTTERLNALRKSVIKENAQIQYEVENTKATEERHQEARAVQEYYDLIKEIMEDREHIEKPKAKTSVTSAIPFVVRAGKNKKGA